MANLPATQPRDPRAATIERLLRKGYSSGEIARKLARDDKRKFKSVRNQIRQLIAADEGFRLALGLTAQGALMEGMIPITEALIRRACRGNVPAIKLAMEASGFYSPKTKHEHSGELKISLTQVSRPPREEDVIDAQVVDD